MKRSIGIVILNYNTWQETVKVVGEILQQECAHDLFIQVVDNDSPNGSFFRLKEELAQYAKHAGADGIVAASPSYMKLADCELIDFFRELAASLALNFLLFLLVSFMALLGTV